MAVKLWVEEYRPRTLDEYVWRDPEQRALVEKWIEQRALPHLLLSGVSGTGKTSLARLILRLIGIPDGDILDLNASIERNVDTVQRKIIEFVSTWALNDTGLKYVLLDEADRMSPLAQDTLRGVMEQHHDNARFVLTCVTGDTKVYLASGHRPASNIRFNDVVRSGAGGTLVNRATRITRTERLVRVKTQHGFSIEVTPSHRFKTRLADAEWVEAASLKPGDRLVAALNDITGNGLVLDSDTPAEQTEFAAYCVANGHAPHDARRAARSRGWFVKPALLHAVTSLRGLPRFDHDTLRERMGGTPAAIRRFVSQARRTGEVRPKEDGFYEADWDRFTRHIESNWRSLCEQYDLTCETYEDFYRLVVEPRDHESLEGVLAAVGFALGERVHPSVLATLGRVLGFLAVRGTVYERSVTFEHHDRGILDSLAADIRDSFPALKDVMVVEDPHDGPQVTVGDRAFALLLRFLAGDQPGAIPDACTRSAVLGHAYAQAVFGLLGSLDSGHPLPFMMAPPHLSNEEAASFMDGYRDLIRTLSGIEMSLAAVEDDRPSLITETEDQARQFLDKIGTAFTPGRGDILGYLRFRSVTTDDLDAWDFARWAEEFGWDGSTIADPVVSVDEVERACEVYDCCFDDVHSYVTNGLVSHNCNYPERLSPAIRGRTQGFQFAALDEMQMVDRLVDILNTEGVEYDPSVLLAYVERTYPDMRKCINLLQQNSMTGKLLPPRADDEASKDYILEAATLMDAGRFLDARKLIVGQAREEEYPDIFRWMYVNLHLWGDTQDQQDEALLVIRRGLVNHHWCADKEINLAAVLVELTRLKRS